MLTTASRDCRVQSGRPETVNLKPQSIVSFLRECAFLQSCRADQRWATISFGHASCFEEKVFGRMSCLLLLSTFETIPLHEHPPTNLCVGTAFCAHSPAQFCQCAMSMFGSSWFAGTSPWEKSKRARYAGLGVLLPVMLECRIRPGRAIS